MFLQTTAQNRRPFSRTQEIAKQIRKKELMAMCIIHFNETENTPSVLELALRCDKVSRADLSPELEVAFTGLSPECTVNLNEWRAKYHVHTLGDWSRMLKKLLNPESGHCPHCGLMTFADPDTVPIYCGACGENPGRVFERARGISPTRSQ